MVLVVDLGIDVAAISGGDDGRGGLVVVLGPAADFDFRMRRRARALRACTVPIGNTMNNRAWR